MKALRRWRKRDGTMGEPLRFAARVITTSLAPRSWTKSCAVWPIRCSGDASPSRARIGRFRKASVSTRAGQTPSSSPPTTIRSKESRRASSRPRISMRAWPPGDGALAGEARDEGRIIDEAAANAAAHVRCCEFVEEHLQRAKGFVLHRVGGLEQLFDRPAMRLRDGNEIETVLVSRRRRKFHKGIAQAGEENGSSVPFPRREAAAR